MAERRRKRGACDGDGEKFQKKKTNALKPMIDALFAQYENPVDNVAENMQVANIQSKKIVDLPDEVLRQIFLHIADPNFNKPSSFKLYLEHEIKRKLFIQSKINPLKEFARLGTICRRFHYILATTKRSDLAHIPKIPIGFRIRAQEDFSNLSGKVTVYLYGGNGAQRVARHVEVGKIADEILCTEEVRFLYANNIWITDELIDVLINEVPLANIEEAHFYDIQGVWLDEATKKEKMIALLNKMSNATVVEFLSDVVDIDAELITEDLKTSIADDSVEVENLNVTSPESYAAACKAASKSHNRKSRARRSRKTKVRYQRLALLYSLFDYKDDHENLHHLEGNCVRTFYKKLWHKVDLVDTDGTIGLSKIVKVLMKKLAKSKSKEAEITQLVVKIKKIIEADRTKAFRNV